MIKEIIVTNPATMMRAFLNTECRGYVCASGNVYKRPNKKWKLLLLWEHLHGSRRTLIYDHVPRSRFTP